MISISPPLRMKLAPGKYHITYSHPHWGENKRTKTVVIEAGQTIYEKDWVDQQLIQEAINHFSLSQKMKDEK